jgi:phage replication O-like protein O
MRYQKTTQVPNEVFDRYLKELSFSELKVLLYIIRQTYGWQLKNGKRKPRDRITHNQFQTKTGLSRRVITDVIQSLILKHLISVTDYQGDKLHTPEQRKGKVGIYYAPCFMAYVEKSNKVCRQQHKPVQNREHNKTNSTKLKQQKRSLQKSRVSDWERMQQILQSRGTRLPN